MAIEKIYRDINFNNERKWKSDKEFADIYEVGDKKAIGYICFWKESKLDFLYGLEKEFIKNGKLASVVIDSYKVEMLWVGDKRMIQSILDKHKDILIKNNFSLDAEEFFNRIKNEQINHDKNEEIFHVVNELFNSWCLFCEEPPTVIFKDNKYHYLSKHSCDI